jgi:hypothetical protein
VSVPGFATARWLVLQAALLAGCAAPPVRVDEETAALVVARGYIESGDLYRWLSCDGPIEVLEVVNCTAGRMSSASFRVEESFVGAPPRARLRASFGYAPHWPEVKLGPGAEYVAVFLTDGTHYQIVGVAAVSETEDGSWAIPATFDDQTVEFPCSTVDREPEPLTFRSPGPRELIASLESSTQEIEQLEEEGSFTAEDGYLYPSVGLSLKHTAEVYAGKSGDLVAGECH